jgi:predicted transcriptional regulator
MTNKEKDQVLAEIKAGAFNYKKSLHSDIVNELEESGYIKVTRTKDGNYHDITDRGKAFIKEGGYIAKEQAVIKAKREKYTFGALSFVAGAIVTKLIDILLDRLI